MVRKSKKDQDDSQEDNPDIGHLWAECGGSAGGSRQITEIVTKGRTLSMFYSPGS